MALIDYQRGDESLIGPRADSLGLGCFVFHLFIGAYIIFGWIISPTPALVIYLVLLPAVVAQWYVNRGSCVINNLESWMRSGRWRDAENREEAGFVLMLCHWLFRVRPHRVILDRLCYVTVVVLWLLAASRFSWSAMAAA